MVKKQKTWLGDPSDFFLDSVGPRAKLTICIWPRRRTATAEPGDGRPSRRRRSADCAARRAREANGARGPAAPRSRNTWRRARCRRIRPASPLTRRTGDGRAADGGKSSGNGDGASYTVVGAARGNCAARNGGTNRPRR